MCISNVRSLNFFKFINCLYITLFSYILFASIHFLHISLYNVEDYVLSIVRIWLSLLLQKTLYIFISQIYIYDKFFKNVKMFKK